MQRWAAEAGGSKPGRDSPKREFKLKHKPNLSPALLPTCATMSDCTSPS